MTMETKISNIRKNVLAPSGLSDGRLPFHPILMMNAARLGGYTYEEFMCDYRKLVDANMKALELYGHDAVSVISDPFRETSAFGADVRFDGDSAPVASHIIHSYEDTLKLSVPDVYASERTLDRIKAVELFKEKLPSGFPIIGWVEGAFAETADLMGVSELMMELVLAPEHIKELMNKTLAVAKDFAAAQIKAGANIIGVGDAVCSQISSDMYREFVQESHRELFAHIHSMGALVKLHICGNITHILEDLATEDIDILDVDWMVSMGEAADKMGPDTMICGNLDPVSVVMNGTEETIREKFAEIKKSINPENWIFMAGCEIPRDTPVENMLFMRKLSMKV